MMPDDVPMEVKDAGWRMPASVLIGVGWLVFVIIWLFFYASGYSIWKNLGVLFASLVIVISLEAALWIGFGMRMGQARSAEGRAWMAYGNMRWRAALSIAVALGWAVFFIIWLLVYADSYSGYQNLAVILVSLLIAGGLTAVTWTGMWRQRY
jgi:hypothetical protein